MWCWFAAIHELNACLIESQNQWDRRLIRCVCRWHASFPHQKLTVKMSTVFGHGVWSFALLRHWITNSPKSKFIWENTSSETKSIRCQSSSESERNCDALKERRKSFSVEKPHAKLQFSLAGKGSFPSQFWSSFRPRVEMGTLIYYWPVLFLFTWRILSLSKIAKRQSSAKYTGRQQDKSTMCRKPNRFQITFEWFLPQIEPHSNSNKIYHLTGPSVH